MLQLWMVLRYMREGRRFLSPSILLAVFGIALGVAALVISMAVVSGYESTLKRTLINMHGHLMVVRRGGVDNPKDMTDDIAKIKSLLPTMKAMTPFLVVEGLIVHQKKLSGIALEGVDPKTIGTVVALQSRLIDGEFNLARDGRGVAGAIIGKGIAKKFGLKLGEEFRLVIPVGRGQHMDNFRPKTQAFVVHGIVDLGRADYDERYIVTDIESAQKFGETTGRISGWRIRLAKTEQAIAAKSKLEEELGPSFWIRTWRDPNRNLLEAVQYEKTVIFIIVSLMMVAAAFNVASTLYLIVVRRYSQISILLAMGVRKRFIRLLFSIQGLVIGAAGTVCGLILGWIGCRIFFWLETTYGLFPGKVYYLDHVDLEIRFADIASILFFTLVICYLATLAPARRGAKLTPIEGLKYE